LPVPFLLAWAPHGVDRGRERAAGVNRTGLSMTVNMKIDLVGHARGLALA